uniref:uncharacterized protein LOC120335081 n=1 Tax=Styela clava TaxID=7725 RepID=UPI00193A489F|nr:uncharacterized protein LOC120335081 [Styela clava]
MKLGIQYTVVVLILLPLLQIVSGRGTWNASGSYEYYVSKNGVSLSYIDSMNFCNDNGGQLALVKTKEIQEFIQTLVDGRGEPPYAFFIGLTDPHKNHTYLWSDGENVTYTNWRDGQPNSRSETCVMIGWVDWYDKDLRWRDTDCVPTDVLPKGYLCQRRIGNYFSQWSSWSECSRTRNRTCIKTGRVGPKNCTDSEIKHDLCSLTKECPITTATETIKSHARTTTTMISSVPSASDISEANSTACSCGSQTQATSNEFFLFDPVSFVLGFIAPMILLVVAVWKMLMDRNKLLPEEQSKMPVSIRMHRYEYITEGQNGANKTNPDKFEIKIEDVCYDETLQNGVLKESSGYDRPDVITERSKAEEAYVGTTSPLSDVLKESDGYDKPIVPIHNGTEYLRSDILEAKYGYETLSEYADNAQLKLSDEDYDDPEYAVMENPYLKPIVTTYDDRGCLVLKNDGSQNSTSDRSNKDEAYDDTGCFPSNILTEDVAKAQLKIESDYDDTWNPCQIVSNDNDECEKNDRSKIDKMYDDTGCLRTKILETKTKFENLTEDVAKAQIKTEAEYDDTGNPGHMVSNDEGYGNSPGMISADTKPIRSCVLE